jgi:signal transduction histidine kinase/DNA-binding NarL/FixJ family response regulator/HPt (histidine-containing phosphotransfer) domain-containing protein
MRQTSSSKASNAVRTPETGTPSLLQISLVALLTLTGSEMLKPFLPLSDPMLQQVLTIGIGTIVALLVAFLTRRGHVALQGELDEVRLARQRLEEAHHALQGRNQQLEQNKRDLEARLTTYRQSEEALRQATDALTARADTQAAELAKVTEAWHKLTTERGSLEQALQQAQTELTEANRTKSEFLANMSHEIRTPLNGVIGMTQLLLDTNLTPEQKDYAETARGSADMLLTIVNDLLDFSELETGTFELEEKDFTVRDTLEEVTDLFAETAAKKRLELTSFVHHDVPMVLHGDATRLRQVLMNLLGNALKFTETGQVSLHTELVQATTDDVSLRFTIRDTGIGIPSSRLANLFQAFSQIDPSSTRKYGGTGLGLAISKKIVECMKGEIGVESEPAKGSTFWFIVHLRPPTAAPIGVTATLAVEVTSPRVPVTVVQQPRILVAEDNPVNQKLISRLLEKLGYHAKVVFNGREALEEAAANSYDAVLMDCQMPEMDGLSATGEIRGREVALGLPHLPIIALTAHIMPGDRERCLAAGMDDYLSKPLNPDKLQATLAHWVAWAREQMATASVEPAAKVSSVPLSLVETAEPTPSSPPAPSVSLADPAFSLSSPFTRTASDEDEARDNTALIFDLKAPFAPGADDQDEEARDNTALIFDLDTAFGKRGLEQEESPDEPEQIADPLPPASPPVGFRILPSTDTPESDAHGAHDPNEQLSPSESFSSPAWEDQYQSQAWNNAAGDPFAPAEDETPQQGDFPSVAPFTSAAVFDLDEALDRVDGDKVLLSEMAELFLESYPGYLSRIKEALVQEDLSALTQAAHALKGSVGNFTTREPFEVARALEQIGRQGDIGEALQVVVKLENALSQLTPQLENLRQEVSA